MNSELSACIVRTLASQAETVPCGSVAVLLHTAAGIASEFSKPRDKEETRNYRVYAELMPSDDSKYTSAAISGAFKPPQFIHPFERHYSLPGYLDQPVLSAFFAATDARAVQLTSHPANLEGKGFLSFVYMFFLLIHPFIDRNGRVARGLLDYYNAKLRFGLSPVWHNSEFKKHPTHKEAFRIFFDDEVRIPPREECDPYPISHALRPHLDRMADYMLNWAEGVARGESFEQRPHIDHFNQLLAGDQ
jgi:hypothetical protein